LLGTPAQSSWPVCLRASRRILLMAIGCWQMQKHANNAGGPTAGALAGSAGMSTRTPFLVNVIHHAFRHQCRNRIQFHRRQRRSPRYRLLNFLGPSFGHRLAQGLAERRVRKVAIPRLALSQIRVRRGCRQVALMAQPLISVVTFMVAQIPSCIGTSLPRRQ